MGILDRPVYDEVESAIKSGNFDAIPQDRKSNNYFKVMGWPPKQFTCGKCGFEYDGVVPQHECGRPDAFQHDVFILDFCTHCGNTFNQFDGRHECYPYGKHARRTDMKEDTYYMRVFPTRDGRHHIDPYKDQYLAILNLVTKEITWTTITRQKTPQEIEWERRRELDNSMYDTEDDCLCVCCLCFEEEGQHCGDDLLGCHEKEVEIPSTWKTKSYTDLNEQTTWATGRPYFTIEGRIPSVKPTLIDRLRKWWNS